ncbi:hypothetical protein BDN71DRAFT_1508944 [Pleurotus eryngii]|uniref:Mug135-like C-terminal domain-containing protein n=1 Tax=Pleurotus eryngii TaxID=5323 RepID=A0A9P5ZUT0_PLEER|nr:hypothetical protein BDN71DRAFT_1508944 [Pleurotus eryngii]
MIQLPELSVGGHQLLDRLLPPPPSDPPVNEDVAKAYVLAHETARLYEHHAAGPFITNDDVCNSAVYAAKILATRTAHMDLVTALQEALAPVEAPLRADFQALRADMQDVREDLGKEARRSRRLAAIVGATFSTRTFESVPFANFDDPVTAPHNLPTLHSLDAVNGLEDEPLRAYVRGYYPGTESDIERAQCIALILTAIGASKPTRN